MKRLAKFYFSHKKTCVAMMSIAIAAFVFYIPDIAFAADLDPEITKLLKSIGEIGSVVLNFASALLWPVLLMIGSLLDNDLIFGGEMGERLLGIWVEIRNLVNIVFVLILLAIAVYNIVGAGEEGIGGLQLSFKTILPKFILALIAVNFSFLAVKVVLDFTNVITGAVFALPTTVMDSSYAPEKKAQELFCNGSADMPFKNWACKGTELSANAKNFFNKLDRSNITVVYAMRFGKATNLKYIQNGLSDIAQLGFNVIFNTLLYIIYAVSFIVLFLVLLFRLIVLWIGVVMSPILALSIVLPNLKDLAGGAGELQDKFVKHAIAPIKIGLVLSIGYIMLDGFDADKTIHGTVLSSSTLTAIDPNALLTGITSLQQLMISVAVVVIVWVGVFSAAEETEAKIITSVIREKGEEWGKFIAKLPTYAQMIPVGGKFGKQTASLAEVGASISQYPGYIASKQERPIWSSLDAEALQNWRQAGKESSRAFMKAFAKNPELLKTPEGWGVFKDTMINKHGVTTEGFRRTFGTTHDDYKRAAEAMYGDSELRNYFDGTDLEGKNSTDIIAAVEKEPGKSLEINNKDDAIDAIARGEEPKVLKNQTQAFRNWSSNSLGELQKIDSRIRKAIATAIIKDPDSQGYIEAVKPETIAGLEMLAKNLQNASNVSMVEKAIAKARTSSLKDDQISKIVNTLDLRSDMSEAAKKVLAPSNSTQGNSENKP